MIRYLYLSLVYITLSSCSTCSGDITETSDKIPVTNYGHNIVVAIDLSNRVLNKRTYEDPTVVQLITDNLPTVFRQSAQININDKFSLVTINESDFLNDEYPDSVFKIDLTRFNTSAVDRSDYLFHNDEKPGSLSLKRDVEELNSTFSALYQKKKTGTQLPADMWYFLKDKISFPVIDTSSQQFKLEERDVVTTYQNYLIIITDGYIEAGRYADAENMRINNKTRYCSERLIADFRNAFNKSKISNIDSFYRQNGYGIIPVENPMLKKCKVLLLELYDRSIINGVSTKTPTDAEVLKLFWKNWLIDSGIQPESIQVESTFQSSLDLKTLLQHYFSSE